ncbi:NADH-quinone oxidoreductase subunit C [Rossellomorea sp. GAMAL-10_SWC]
MSEDKSKEQLKKEAAERAKEAARRKMEQLKAEKEAAKNTEVQKEEAHVVEEPTVENEVKQEEPASEDEKAKALALAKAKAVAAAKAKAAAIAKQKAAEASEQAQAEESEETSDDDKAKALAAAKAKAVAAAKAKAAALAKQKAAEGGETPADGADDEKAKAIAAAKAKAVAAAKAKAAALAKQKATGGEDTASAGSDDEVAKAKAKAIAVAKAKAAAAAKAKGKTDGGKEAPVEEVKPSHNQPLLDEVKALIEREFGTDVIEESIINTLSKHDPTFTIKRDAYFKVAQFLKNNEQLQFTYLSGLHGTDFIEYMEVYSYIYSYKRKHGIALKVKADREQPIVDSITPIWEGANWPERETYDLLGIQFEGHPKLERILLPDNWVGYPLRKDYVQFDEGV